MGQPKSEAKFASPRQLLDYLREHADSVDHAYVFIYGCPEFTDATTGTTFLQKNAGMTLRMCSGQMISVPRPRAVELLNDGILARLNVTTTFH